MSVINQYVNERVYSLPKCILPSHELVSTAVLLKTRDGLDTKYDKTNVGMKESTTTRETADRLEMVKVVGNVVLPQPSLTHDC
jgi:hypothetical protein